MGLMSREQIWIGSLCILLRSRRGFCEENVKWILGARPFSELNR
jgi:hypothetical protein